MNPKADASRGSWAGVDLAAETRDTAVVTICEASGSVAVDSVAVGADDATVCETTLLSDQAGIDVPFGWPESFIGLIAAHSAGRLEPPASTDRAWRREHALRATDRAIHPATGLTPLSVSCDRIAYPALRWAGISARLRQAGVDTARDGSGPTCEVYPAASLAVWGLSHRGYKGRWATEQREAILAGLRVRAPPGWT